VKLVKKKSPLDRQYKIQGLAVIITFEKLYETLILDNVGAKKETDLVSYMTVEKDQLV
jgi:hypothetical protein